MKLKTARRNARLTQQQLATAASVPGAQVDKSLIAHLEKGTRSLALTAYVRVINIARALGLTPDQLSIPSTRVVRPRPRVHAEASE